MRVGYGRGYYGVGQLAPQAPKRRGGGWIKIAVVVGVGAVVWYMWPRKPEYAPGLGGNEPRPPAPPSPPLLEGSQSSPLPEGQLPSTSFTQVTQATQPTHLAQLESLDQVAEARGYPSQKAYEDAVVASARQLQDAGAKVAFAPHLQHLTPRLGT